MNSLIGDSRVRGVKVGKLQSKIVDVWCAPGATFSRLEEEMRKSIILHHGEDPIMGPHHIYISGGICNITKRLKVANRNYEEVIFETSKSSQIINSTIDQINNLRQKTINENATPIFCTLFPMNLSQWNTARLNQNKTMYLSYAEEYNSMQSELNKAVLTINSHIFNTNKILNLATPQFDKQLIHNRKNYKSFKYSLLADGCHPNTTLNNQLANSLYVAITKNRQN